MENAIAIVIYNFCATKFQGKYTNPHSQEKVVNECHKEYLSEIEHLIWSPQSLDLNIIENK